MKSHSVPKGKTSPVLVTGGEYRIALAAIRSLGRAGIEVAVLASTPWAIGFHSRYCAHKIITPPDHQKQRYQQFLLDLVQRQNFSGLIVCDDLAASHAGEIQFELAKSLPILLPSAHWIELSLNKRRMLDFCRNQAIPIPATAFPQASSDIEREISGFRFPVLVKGTRGDSSRHLRLLKTTDMSAVVTAFKEVAEIESRQGITDRPVIQEYVTGDVYSVIVLVEHGVVRTFFAMKKLHTYPSWGGICVEAESVHERGLHDVVVSFFQKLPWHGVAELEFIRDTRDGEFRFVELNPDFNWGLEFAIYMGIDFPLLAYRTMTGGSVALGTAPEYPAGKRFVWFLPEAVNYLKRNPGMWLRYLRKAIDRRMGNDICLADLPALLRQVRRSLLG